MKKPFAVCWGLLLCLGMGVLGAFVGPPASAAPSPRILDSSIPAGPADNFFEASFRIRVPEGTGPPEGVLVLVPGTDGDSRPWAESHEWQQFADRHRLVLVGCHFRGDGVEAYDFAPGGSGAALLRALGQSGLPEGRSSRSLLVFGHSAGAQFAFQFARWKPERVRAYAAIKGGSYPHEEGGALPGVPALVVAGEHDEAGRRRSAARLWEVLRLQGHPACLLLERGQGHGLGDAVCLAQSFFADVLQSSPVSPAVWKIVGGLEDGKVRSARAQDARDPVRVWLPGDATARAWQAAHRPLRLADLARAEDAASPGLRVEPDSLDFGDLDAGQDSATLPFAPRLIHILRGPAGDSPPPVPTSVSSTTPPARFNGGLRSMPAPCPGATFMACSGSPHLESRSLPKCLSGPTWPAPGSPPRAAFTPASCQRPAPPP